MDLISPDSPEGEKMAALLKDAIVDVQAEKALNIVREGQPGTRFSGQSTVIWAQAAHTVVSKPTKEDMPRVFKRLRELCEKNGMEPFPEDAEKAIITILEAKMAAEKR